MVDGIGFSAAAECKRMLSLDGTEGVKINLLKSEKREKYRKVRQYHITGLGIKRKNSQL